jgi:hypothetical protein
MARESPCSLLRLSSARSASAQNAQPSSVKNSANTVRLVGPGSSGASEHKTKKKTMNGNKIAIFFMRYYTDILFIVNNCSKKKGGMNAPFFNDI